MDISVLHRDDGPFYRVEWRTRMRYSDLAVTAAAKPYSGPAARYVTTIQASDMDPFTR